MHARYVHQITKFHVMHGNVLPRALFALGSPLLKSLLGTFDYEIPLTLVYILNAL